MRKLFPALAVVMVLPFCPARAAEQTLLSAPAIVAFQVENPPDVLEPPPLPKLGASEWKSEKTVFPGALNVEDEQQNPLNKTLDLPGTKYSARLNYVRRADALDDDLMNRIASEYDRALAAKHYDYRVKIPGYSYYVVGASGDGAEGGEYGESAVAQGKLRFISVSTHEPDVSEDTANGPSPPKDVTVNGDMQIFVSDEIPVAELVQKIDAQLKK